MGELQLLGTADPILNLDPTNTATRGLRIDSSSCPLFLLVDSEDNGDVIRIAGPIQTQYQTLTDGGSEKIGDKTAMDLSVGGGSEYHLTQGTAEAAILGGVRNAIASELQMKAYEKETTIRFLLARRCDHCWWGRQ